MTRRAPPNRRALLSGASSAALLLAAPAAGSTKATELDGELIALLDEARETRLNPDAETVAYLNADPVFAVPPEEGMLALAAALPARTPEGLRRKAEAVADWLAGGDRANGLIHLNRDGDALVAWSLLRDLLGAETLPEARPRAPLTPAILAAARAAQRGGVA
ncbi:hypothetical protein [Roseomonas indoligenes]|uniref:Tat pathway signal protein n=1 Tax=Roseomonas indoligenes TaxID=2820811 RepID=A0A940S6G0_9PROT|nr:hypothetical protein [Pararoseomonas indoligenes]MBP0493994.1 hypothetical protein [Pararoseomonas indoligenes]